VDPRRLIPVLSVLAGACVVATLVVAALTPADPASPGRPVPVAPEVPATRPGPAGVLAGWDQRRAAAWATADVEALAGLYAEGSRTGAADLRLLRHYRRRGLTVVDLTTQLLALRVVGRSPGRLVLVVTDRVAGGRVVGRGTTPIALPTDRASTRRVVLVRDGGTWLVAEARDQASAAASTSRTSSSSKS
jgi:hypothetical protein